MVHHASLAQQASVQASRAVGRGRRVTDLATRVVHGLMALCFAGAYLTAESETWRLVHNTLGETMLGLLLVRLVDGLIGPRPQRWRSVFGRLGAASQQVRSLLLQGFGGAFASSPATVRGSFNKLLPAWLPWLTTGLLLLIVPVVASGLAMEWGWDHRLDELLQTWLLQSVQLSMLANWAVGLGEDVLEEAHELAANLMLVLVIGHLFLLFFQSVIKRANMAAPMFSGINPSLGPGPDLVVDQRRGLAWALIFACLAYWVVNWLGLPAAVAWLRVWRI